MNFDDTDHIIETDEPTEERQQSRFPVFAQLALLFMVLAIIFGGAYLPQLLNNREDSFNQPTAQTAALGVRTDENALIIDSLDEVTVEADAAYVYDVATGRVLFKKGEGTSRPLASITKLMTALVAYEIMSAEESVDIPFEAVLQEGDSGIYDGERFDAMSLSKYALISSSNDAAYALADAAGDILFAGEGTSAFVRGMNARADELGLGTLEFYNPTGLDVSKNEPGAVGSARDVTFLMEYILTTHPELLEPTRIVSTRLYNEGGQYHDVENTNIIIGEIPNLLGSKTGYTDLAGGNLTVAFNAGLNRPVIVTVLGASWNGRFTDVLTLIEAVQEAIQSETSTE